MDLVSQWPFVQTDDGYFRRVNHARRLLTTGFLSEAKMIEYTANVRMADSAKEAMAARYVGAFLNHHNQNA